MVRNINADSYDLVSKKKRKYLSQPANKKIYSMFYSLHLKILDRKYLYNLQV